MDETKKTGQQAGQPKQWEKPQGKECGSCCTTKPERKEEKPMQQQGSKSASEQPKPYGKEPMKPEGKKSEEGKKGL